jgi:hypothetical protein
MGRITLALLILIAIRSPAQSVVISAHVACQSTNPWPGSWSGPIVGVIINQTHTAVTDLEFELAILERSNKGINIRYYRRFVVVPSLNQVGLVKKLEPDGYTSFSIPDEYNTDATCEKHHGNYTVPDDLPNVAAIAVTRINGKPVLPADQKGKPAKHATLDSMLLIPAETPKNDNGPTLYDLTVENARLSATIINKQLNDCLLTGTWACTFRNGSNINVVISQY